MSTQPHSAANEVIVRQARPEDAETCGRICFDAFSAINAKHGFPCDFPNSDVTKGLLTGLFSHPGFYCVVAEADGNIVGSNALDERAVIAGIGPITVDPSTQNLGVGRKLIPQRCEPAMNSTAPFERSISSRAIHTEVTWSPWTGQ